MILSKNNSLNSKNGELKTDIRHSSTNIVNSNSNSIIDTYIKEISNNQKEVLRRCCSDVDEYLTPADKLDLENIIIGANSKEYSSTTLQAPKNTSSSSDEKEINATIYSFTSDEKKRRSIASMESILKNVTTPITSAHIRWRRIRLALLVLARLSRPDITIISNVNELKQTTENTKKEDYKNLIHAYTATGVNIYNNPTKEPKKKNSKGEIKQKKINDSSSSKKIDSDNFKIIDNGINHNNSSSDNAIIDNDDKIDSISNALAAHRLNEKLFALVAIGDCDQWERVYSQDPKKKFFDGTSKESSVNVRNGFGLTQLHIAAQNGDEGMIKTLLINGADPTIASIPVSTRGKVKSETPLELAIRWGQKNAVKLLIQDERVTEKMLWNACRMAKGQVKSDLIHALENIAKHNGSICLPMKIRMFNCTVM